MPFSSSFLISINSSFFCIRLLYSCLDYWPELTILFSSVILVSNSFSFFLASLLCLFANLIISPQSVTNSVSQKRHGSIIVSNPWDTISIKSGLYGVAAYIHILSF